MKKIVVLLIMLFSVASMAQTLGWTDLKETNITVGANAYDIFTNGGGNHIIVQETNALKYYRMKVDGTYDIGPVDIEPPPVTVISPSITGNLDTIYVVYRKSNDTSIKTKYSVHGGAWTTLTQVPSNSNGSNIECVFSKDNLHITYVVGTQVLYSRKYVKNASAWTTPSLVSGTYSASNPRIGVWKAGTTNKVYITYNTAPNVLRWSGYNVTNGVLSPVGWSIATGDGISNRGLTCDDTYIYAFNMSSVALRWNFETISNGQQNGHGESNGNTDVDRMFSTIISNDTPYTAAWNPIANFETSIVRIKASHTPPPELVPSLSFDVIYENPDLTPVDIVNLSSAGNDVHVVWKDNLSNNKLRYKYYDDVPIPPQNLTVTKSANNHPLLTWINPNPDVSLYKIYRRNACVGDWEVDPINSTNNLYYEDLTQSYCTAIPPQQCTYLCNFEYRVTAVDPGPKESGYSNTVSAWLIGGPPQKAGVEDPVVERVFEYSLGQNYPNPFNPTTTINYSIKTVGDISLKLYDILGTEVASLVNELKEPGNYSVTFNAANLSSGLYVYILSTNNFMDTKKLILLK